jgi:SAM-dependent methyltransferase
MAPPVVFDRRLVRARLQRALRQGYADFLLGRAVADLDERLAPVLRRFVLALDLGTPTAAAARALRASARAEAVVRMAPLPERGDAGPALIGDEEALPFAPASFDLVVSLLALQAVNDLPGSLVQIRRALRPDGLFVGCLLGGASLAELRHAFAAAESALEGGASPRVAPLADLRDLGALLQRAGFALPVADAESLPLRYRSAMALFRDLRAAGEANAVLARDPRTPPRALLPLAASRLPEAPEGGIPMELRLLVMTGWAPHESQSQPARPGSAQVRLAAALGTEERSAGERAGGA